MPITHNAHTDETLATVFLGEARRVGRGRGGEALACSYQETRTLMMKCLRSLLCIVHNPSNPTYGIIISTTPDT